MNLGLLELRKKVEKYIHKNNNNKDTKRFNSVIGYELEFILRGFFENFTRSNDTDLKDVVFEIDNSLLGGYLKSAAFKIKSKTKAHDIADCVAHANYKDWELDYVNESPPNFKLNFHNKVMEVIKHEI
jgi:hypothetical protein